MFKKKKKQGTSKEEGGAEVGPISPRKGKSGKLAREKEGRDSLRGNGKEKEREELQISAPAAPRHTVAGLVALSTPPTASVDKPQTMPMPSTAAVAPMPSTVDEELGSSEHDGSEEPMDFKPEDGLRAVALYEYRTAQEDEIELEADEPVLVFERDPSGWWTGENSRGQYGLFPGSFVKLVDAERPSPSKAATRVETLETQRSNEKEPPVTTVEPNEEMESKEEERGENTNAEQEDSPPQTEPKESPPTERSPRVSQPNSAEEEAENVCATEKEWTDTKVEDAAVHVAEETPSAVETAAAQDPRQFDDDPEVEALVEQLREASVSEALERATQAVVEEKEAELHAQLAELHQSRAAEVAALKASHELALQSAAAREAALRDELNGSAALVASLRAELLALQRTAAGESARMEAAVAAERAHLHDALDGLRAEYVRMLAEAEKRLLSKLPTVAAPPSNSSSSDALSTSSTSLTSSASATMLSRSPSRPPPPRPERPISIRSPSAAAAAASLSGGVRKSRPLPVAPDPKRN